MSELQDNVALAFRQWNEQREQIAALEARNQQLREALTKIGFPGDAPYPWEECERIARAALAATEEKP